jgi:hypothetical protein
VSRRCLLLVHAALAMTLAGCALGNVIVGAPPASEHGTANPLLARRCGGCHEVPNPARMSREEWSRSLARMQRRIHLPASEWDSLAAMGRSE